MGMHLLTVATCRRGVGRCRKLLAGLGFWRWVFAAKYGTSVVAGIGCITVYIIFAWLTIGILFKLYMVWQADRELSKIQQHHAKSAAKNFTKK